MPSLRFKLECSFHHKKNLTYAQFTKSWNFMLANGNCHANIIFFNCQMWSILVYTRKKGVFCCKFAIFGAYAEVKYICVCIFVTCSSEITRSIF